MVCLLTLLHLPGLSLSQAQEDDTTAAPQDDTVAIPGVPPGQDVDSGRGAGLQLEGQGQLDGQRQPSALKLASKRDGKFHLVEATIDDIHKALKKRELSCVDLTKRYFKRIKAYSGHCVKYDKNGDGISPDYDFFMPSGKGGYLGVVSTIANAGKVNAIQTVNLRPANITPPSALPLPTIQVRDQRRTSAMTIQIFPTPWK
jgi:hypothetical protein